MHKKLINSKRFITWTRIINGLTISRILLGLPITELAYGRGAINTNLAIIALNAPFCYLVGITCMELFGKENVNLWRTTNSIFYSIFSNPIALSVLMGLALNFLSFELITPFEKMLSLISLGALPLALFGLGGILIRYKFSNDLGKVFIIILLCKFRYANFKKCYNLCFNGPRYKCIFICKLLQRR